MFHFKIFFVRHGPFLVLLNLEEQPLVGILALSGPVEMLITDVDNPSQYVRFYVRQGEMSEIYLVSGTYEATWKIGKCWFGDDIGFGELYTEGAREDNMSVQTKQEGGWIVNWRWTDIL